MKSDIVLMHSSECSLNAESNFELEFINPEHLCGRVMMRALVMWDSVEPAEAWVERQLPSILQVKNKNSLCLLYTLRDRD